MHNHRRDARSIRRPQLLDSILMAIIFWVAPLYAVHAFELDIDPSIIKAFADLSGEFPSLRDAEGAVQDAAKHVKPSLIVNFNDLANSTNTITNAFRNAPPPPFDGWAKYSVSFDDLRGCLTHDQAMNSLQADSDALAQQIQHASDQLQVLDQYVQQAKASRDAVQVLIDFYGKAIWDPIWGTMWIGDWLAADNALKPAYNNAISVITDYRTKFSASLEKAKIQEGNLQSNIRQMSGYHPLFGTYKASNESGTISYNPGFLNHTTVTAKNVSIEFAITALSSISGAMINAQDTFDVVIPGIAVKPVDDSYGFTQSSGSISLPRIAIEFAPTGVAPPTMAAHFTGTISNDCKISGPLVLERTNQNPALKWRIAIPITLDRH